MTKEQRKNLAELTGLNCIMGPIEAELRAKQNFTYDELIGWRSRRKLSRDAMTCLSDATLQLTGMRGISSYYLAEVFSEAIEAAETLGL